MIDEGHVSFPVHSALREVLKVTLGVGTDDGESGSQASSAPTARPTPTGSESPEHRLRSPAASAQEER
jgi:hypothetical protein